MLSATIKTEHRVTATAAEAENNNLLRLSPLPSFNIVTQEVEKKIDSIFFFLVFKRVNLNLFFWIPHEL